MIRAVIIAFAVFASGCSQFASLDDEQAQQLWHEQQSVMTDYDSWDMHARAFLKLPGRAYNINLRWQRDEQTFRLLLQAPFGQGVIRIEADGDGPYRLQLPDGQVVTRGTPEVLLEDSIGWSLPISGLIYWVRGLPRPDQQYRHRIDEAGRLRSMDQDTWAIRYNDYFEPPELAQLPRKITLSRNDLNLKLVIERWQAIATDESPSDLFPEFN